MPRPGKKSSGPGGRPSGQRPSSPAAPKSAKSELAPWEKLPFIRLKGTGPEAGEIEIGQVVGIFGIRGEVRLHLHNRESSLLDGPARVVLIGAAGQRLEAQLEARPGAGIRILGQFKGLTDRDVAECLMNWRIWIRRVDLPEPDEGEVYVADLIGLPCFIGDKQVGEILAVHDTDGGDIVEIGNGVETWFVPGEGGFITKVDVAGRRIELVDGALDEL